MFTTLSSEWFGLVSQLKRQNWKHCAMIGSQAEMKSHTALITSLVGMTSCQTETVHCEKCASCCSTLLDWNKISTRGFFILQNSSDDASQRRGAFTCRGRAAAVFSGMCSTVQLSWIKVRQRGEESEDKNTETWLRSSFVWCTDTVSNVRAKRIMSAAPTFRLNSFARWLTIKQRQHIYVLSYVLIATLSPLSSPLRVCCVCVSALTEYFEVVK